MANPNLTKSQLIINALEQMDVGMLDILLDDEKTYQCATKEVFLKKLSKLFKNFQQENDTFFVARPGKCKSDECTNKGCSGYAFVGNKTDNYMSLVFEQVGDEYIDICNCNDFVADEYELEIEGTYRHRGLFLKDDELADFVPSVDYLITSQKCQYAYEEIIQFGNQLMNKEMYTDWVAKHFYLYDSLGNIFSIPAAYKNFADAYILFNRFTETLKHEDQANEALTALQHINSSNETELLAWLLKYEALKKELLGLEMEYEDLEITGNKHFTFSDFTIDSSDFELLHRFIVQFEALYAPVWEKYYVEGSEEDWKEDGYWGLGWHVDRKNYI